MNPKRLLIIAIVLICLFIFIVFLERNIWGPTVFQNKVSPTFEVVGIDISRDFKIQPLSEYHAIDNSKPKHYSKFSLKIPGGELKYFSFKIPFQNTSAKHLFRLDSCNHNGILEKKTFFGWKIVNYSECLEHKPHAPILPGFKGTFGHKVYLEESVEDHQTKRSDISGTYRIRINFLQNCKDLGKEDNGYSIRFGDCEGEVFASSPDFRIQQ